MANRQNLACEKYSNSHRPASPLNGDKKTMIFGGLQKTSVIDYPGKISCVLFLSGCNFDCPYCHNPELVKGHSFHPSFLDEKAVYRFLQERTGLLDGVVISGGEPTLHKDLSSICKRIKRMGYPIKLDTNGSRPEVIKRLIDQGLIDYVAMDVKTGPFYYSPQIVKNYNPEHILASIEIIMESSLAYEFRTTCVKPIVNPHVITKIAKTLKGATLYILQRFHNSKVLHPGFFREADPSYKEEELYDLKFIAGSWVNKCILR